MAQATDRTLPFMMDSPAWTCGPTFSRDQTGSRSIPIPTSRLVGKRTMRRLQRTMGLVNPVVFGRSKRVAGEQGLTPGLASPPFSNEPDIDRLVW
jgi:hypothetical protein